MSYVSKTCAVQEHYENETLLIRCWNVMYTSYSRTLSASDFVRQLRLINDAAIIAYLEWRSHGRGNDDCPRKGKHDQKASNDVTDWKLENNALKVTPTRRQRDYRVRLKKNDGMQKKECRV